MNSHARFGSLCALAVFAFLAGRATNMLQTSAPASSPIALASHNDNPASEPAGGKADDHAEDQFCSPGPAHRALQPLIGTFKGTITLTSPSNPKPVTISGTIIREWVLGGRYIRETYSSSTEEGEFRGIGYLGYNAFDGRYEFVWMDSESTAIVLETGTLNAKTDVLSMSTAVRDTQSGRLVIGHGSVDFSDADHQKSVTYHVDKNGEEYKAFEANFDRVKE
ncbi:MAG TPA: DUF1579 family protein [Phycisphaerales bacterium]|nr:DUF1579 family protein [Phycisphaerales bacterium]